MSDSQKEIIIQPDYLQKEIELLNIHKVVKNNFLTLALYDDLRSELTEKVPKDSRSIINKKIQSCFEGVILDLIDQEIPATIQEFMAMLIAKVKQSSIASTVDNIDDICDMYMDTDSILKSKEYITILSKKKENLSYRLLKARNVWNLINNPGIFYDRNYRPYDSGILITAINAVLSGELEKGIDQPKKGPVRKQ